VANYTFEITFDRVLAAEREAGQGMTIEDGNVDLDMNDDGNQED